MNRLQSIIKPFYEDLKALGKQIKTLHKRILGNSKLF